MAKIAPEMLLFLPDRDLCSQADAVRRATISVIHDSGHLMWETVPNGNMHVLCTKYSTGALMLERSYGRFGVHKHGVV